ncbi:helix-turn-helix domain-containing protein [Streptomyces canus]|uniref:helix-turn-helix domain-containing protein n=1 Tax=Streptomyces canus TaxID=58343 RepID=UPI003F4BB271
MDAGRPIAHVAAEAGISRRCLAKWCARMRAYGENGLLGHSSRPATRPAAAARRHTRVGDRSPQPGEARTQPAPGPRSTNWRAAARGPGTGKVGYMKVERYRDALPRVGLRPPLHNRA